MATTISGSNIKTILANGQDVKVLVVNGTTMWRKITERSYTWTAGDRTKCLYGASSSETKTPTSGGNYNLGSSSGSNAWLWQFDAPANLSGSFKAGTARLRFYRRDSNGATTAGGNSYLDAGQSFNSSGISTMANLAKDNRTPVTVPDGAGWIELTLPDALFTKFAASGNRTLGGRISWVNALGTINETYPVTITAVYNG